MVVGGTIKMCGEVQRYTIQAFNDRFIVATKPFNAQKTYLYTLIDIERRVRGPLNSIFGLPFDVNTPKMAERFLAWMDEDEPGTWGVSRRREKPLTETECSSLWTPGAVLANGGGKKCAAA